MSYNSHLTFQEAVAQGFFSSIKPWSKIGFSPSAGTTECDIWSYATTQPAYVFPTAAAAMECLSSDNTQDIGTVIKGAMNMSVTADAGGTTTTLVDADVDFTAATAVAVGDTLIIDPSGTTPEWGYITGVATHTLTFAGGLSSGGTGASRKYAVLDYSAHTGALAVKIEYLTGAYAEKSEILALNGTTVLTTTNTDLFRINSFRIIATGSGNKPLGNLTLRNIADTPVYSFITAGYTRARNIVYTVPAGKTLWVDQINGGFCVTGSSKVEYARIWTRANVEPSTRFNTGSLFYPYTEFTATNSTCGIKLYTPTQLPQKTDIRVACLASAAGVAQIVLRGYLTTP